MGFSDATVAEQCPAIEAQKAQVNETNEEERERERENYQAKRTARRGQNLVKQRQMVYGEDGF